MAWTTAEIESVRAAVLALATGQRAVSVSYAGPPARTVSYGTAQLGELRALLATMEASVTGTAAPPRFRRAVFSRGYRRGC